MYLTKSRFYLSCRVYKRSSNIKDKKSLTSIDNNIRLRESKSNYEYIYDNYIENFVYKINIC